jgi:hypothetical protein
MGPLPRRSVYSGREPDQEIGFAPREGASAPSGTAWSTVPAMLVEVEPVSAVERDRARRAAAAPVLRRPGREASRR